MNNLLEHLGKDTLPAQMIKDFIQWCVWQQARPALVMVLNKSGITDVAQAIEKTDDLPELTTLNATANKTAKERRGNTGPLALSAAEAATFEFTNMMNAINETDTDPEAVSFFSMRVCGWAAWAEKDFANASIKTEAEASAKEAQEACLDQLWLKYATQESSST